MSNSNQTIRSQEVIEFNLDLLLDECHEAYKDMEGYNTFPEKSNDIEDIYVSNCDPWSVMNLL